MSFKYEYTNMHSKSYGWVTAQTLWLRSKDFFFSTTAFLLCMLLVRTSQTWWTIHNSEVHVPLGNGRQLLIVPISTECSVWLQRENYFGFLYCLLKCVSNGLERKDQPTGGQSVTSTDAVTWWQTPEHSCRGKTLLFLGLLSRLKGSPDTDRRGIAPGSVQGTVLRESQRMHCSYRHRPHLWQDQFQAVLGDKEVWLGEGEISPVM